MKKTLTVLLILAVAVTSIFAQGTKEDGEKFILEKNRQSIKEYYLQGADEVVVAADSVTFTDDSGRGPITIKKNPEKVAILYGSHTCLWYEAGGTADAIIGGKSNTALFTEQIGRDIANDEGMEILATSASGKTWDVEKIIGTQPDLIICSTAMSGYSTISAPAEAAGIPVIAVRYSGLGDYLKWFKVFANIGGDPALFDSIAMETLNDVADIIIKVPTDREVRVLSLMAQTKGMKANTEYSDMGVIIKELSGINVISVDSEITKLDISTEEVYALDPEMIFVQSMTSIDTGKEIFKGYYDAAPEVWDSMDCIKNGKVYFMPKELFQNRPNRRYNESYRMIAERLYPDVEF